MRHQILAEANQRTRDENEKYKNNGKMPNYMDKEDNIRTTNAG